jgi:hypothetical protein
MKKLLFALVMFGPAMLFGQSAFTGTWVFSTQSGQFSGKPLTQALQNGVYTCDTCVPKLKVSADGKDHELKGSPYADMISVRMLDDRSIEIVRKKNGKVVGTTKDTVSEDGKTLVSEWSFVADNGQTGNGKATSTRVADGPKGSHKTSGSWQTASLQDASASIMTVTFKATEDSLSMSDQLGDSYEAKFDGKDYPYKGDPGVTSVSLKKIDANTIEETDKRDGNVIFVSRLTVSADGQTLKMENTDKLHGTTARFEAKKQ